MKFKYLYLVSLLLLLAGCADSVDYNPGKYTPSLTAKYLSVGKKSFDFKDAYRSTESLSITSMNTPWAFTDVLDWFSLSKLSGVKSETVQLTVEENLSADSHRLAVFYLQSTDKDYKFKTPISVFQAPAVPFAVADKAEITFNGGASNEEVMISSNCAWEFTVDGGNWLTVSKNNETNTLAVYASENLLNSSREAYISIRYNGELLDMISVIQKAAEISTETLYLQFENTAGTYELKLVSETSWTAYSGYNWIEITPTSGSAGESTLRISALENTGINDRTGYVYIMVGSSTRMSIPVYQKGIYLDFLTTWLPVGSEAGEYTVTISSNTSWVVDYCPDWMAVSSTSGYGSQEITISVEDNPNVTSRIDAVLVSTPGLSLSSSITVYQEGKSFNYGTVSTFECSDKAQNLILNVTSDGKWEAHSNVSWMSVSPESMTGSSELVISLTENTGDNTRTGTIELTIGDQSYTLTVIQEGKYFTIDYTNSKFTSKGATLLIDVVTNDRWTATVEDDQSWITLSQTSGEDNASIVATIADNASVNSRSATIIIETPNDKSLKIPVSQAARYLTVNCQGVNFFASGGTSQDVVISTDAEYSISGSDTWFSITQKENDIFYVTAQTNTTKQQREGTVTVEMTDLVEGTYSIDIPVFQNAEGAYFNILPYDDDNNFDAGAGEDEAGFRLTIIGYGTENNWDSNPGNSAGLVVNVTGYADDKNLDSESSGISGSVSYDDYTGDNNWN